MQPDIAERRRRRARQLDAGPFSADIASFRLHLAAEHKAEGTIRIYCEAACWLAAAHLLAETDKTRWRQVEKQDVQGWMVTLLNCYSDAYAYQQYRALWQFFRWLAAEDGVPDPMAALRPPKVTEKPVPFFTSVELSKLEKACQGNTFAQRRDAAILEVSRASGIRLSEMAGIRYYPDDPIAATWTWNGGRSRSEARAARPNRQGSTVRQPAGWTGISGSGPGTSRATGRGCGSAAATAAR
jgi:integrase/recombinase XerD